ncbi:PPC domain-containing DNA-binding protein [Thermococcus pacificus]|uniref:DNA-binding protein n=1 Tax=Thermococcus pacificus TaxID=71998 RepID=A0A218P999_9EURY|nr:PPC domain-containing DNA-binding protein [Thermococcus pacificus]ASJ07364.1 DNA-binding protein [Thermococcus pacificus]
MEFKPGKVFLMRAPEGVDLLEFVNSFAEKNGINTAIVKGIGSLRNPVVGYYSEETKSYKKIELVGTFELLTLLGNISIKDGKPFAHLHVTLGNANGDVFGGHLIKGAVFVAEVFIQELLGEPLERKKQENGLVLWDSEGI